MPPSPARQRSFPAAIIATLLLAFCIFPAQGWLAYLFPGISGRATIDPGLTIFDIPIHMPFAIDLILVPGLFIILYSTTILVFSARARPVPQRWQILTQRLAAVFISISAILFCLAAGAVISWLLRDHLPANIRNSMRSVAVNADLHFPGAGYPNIHLLGDTLSFLGLIIGLAISIRMMRKPPRVHAQKRTRMTPEQRMTPYQRMLLERRYGTPRQPSVNQTSLTAPRHHELSHGLCRNEPLPTLQPEAVNFRPLG